MPTPRSSPPPGLLALRPFGLAEGLEVETAHRLRGPTYRRITRGAYVSAATETTHERRMQGARLVLPSEAVMGRRSAAWAHGVRFPAPADPVEVVLPPGRRVRSRRELRVRSEHLDEVDVVVSAFGRTTSPFRTTFDLARGTPPEQAIAWADALARAAGVAAPIPGLHLPERYRGLRGVRQAREVLAAVDPRSESPMESRLRWVVLRAGVPTPVPQHVVRDGSGAFVARLDLAWPARRVGLEYDGGHHLERHRHSRDLDRHNRLRALGWMVLQVDAAGLRDRDGLLRLVRTALSGRS